MFITVEYRLQLKRSHFKKYWQGKPDQALRLLHDFIYVDPPILMAWGPMLSSDAVVVNEVASKYNIIQVIVTDYSGAGTPCYN